LAVGVVIGGALATVGAAIVKDLLTPFISAIAQLPDFSDMSLVLTAASSCTVICNRAAGVLDRGVVRVLSGGTARSTT
jgi:large-conductance mechanosensitive channel